MPSASIQRVAMESISSSGSRLQLANGSVVVLVPQSLQHCEHVGLEHHADDLTERLGLASVMLPASTRASVSAAAMLAP